MKYNYMHNTKQYSLFADRSLVTVYKYGSLMHSHGTMAPFCWDRLYALRAKMAQALLIRECIFFMQTVPPKADLTGAMVVHIESGPWLG